MKTIVDKILAIDKLRQSHQTDNNTRLKGVGGKLDEQALRDIFNANGLNYSQIVGDELTTVSMELQDFNYSLTQIVTFIKDCIQMASEQGWDEGAKAVEAVWIEKIDNITKGLRTFTRGSGDTSPPITNKDTQDEQR